jgi:Xaa-Pro aminopeptidase
MRPHELAPVRLEEPALDLVRMRRERHARLQREMEQRGLAALWLSGPGHVRYALGPAVMACDAARATYQRVAALVVRGADAPHLFTPYPEGAPPELPSPCIRPPLYLESDAGVAAALRRVRELLGTAPRGALGIDEFSPALFFALRGASDFELADAAPAVAAAKLCKTPDEIECVRRAQRINERAMLDVQAALRPGLRQSDLTALLLARLWELGASANIIDPIWQVMPESLAQGPYTTHGGVAFPTCTTDRILRQGDVIWVDTGIEYCGYHSDFGRTWIVGADPTPRQQDQFRRWLDVLRAVLELVRPGVTGAELARAAARANGGVRPWPEHFYLIHGTGTESAEMPVVGTDLGEAFDESVVLEPGMVLVLEPAIWDDGAGGYRSEEIVAVTADGWIPLSAHSYAPYTEDGRA